VVSWPSEHRPLRANMTAAHSLATVLEIATARDERHAPGPYGRGAVPNDSSAGDGALLLLDKGSSLLHAAWTARSLVRWPKWSSPSSRRDGRSRPPLGLPARGSQDAPEPRRRPISLDDLSRERRQFGAPLLLPRSGSVTTYGVARRCAATARPRGQWARARAGRRGPLVSSRRGSAPAAGKLERGDRRVSGPGVAVEIAAAVWQAFGGGACALPAVTPSAPRFDVMPRSGRPRAPRRARPAAAPGPGESDGWRGGGGAASGRQRGRFMV